MTLQATFCATLVDEWVRAGVRAAVVAPGSRSAPLTIAIFADGRIETHVRLDERSAAFFALGIALASGAPVVVVTTSGTASAEVHAAVLEADLARVPLIVVTADRPFELHGVGAPQTVVQAGMYGPAVRLALDPGVPDGGAASSWRSLASRAVLEATDSVRGPGPVHLNLAFRDPLVGAPDPLPPGRPDGRPWHEVATDRRPGRAVVEQFTAAISGRRGVFVVGGPIAGAFSSILDLAHRIGWPVIADPRAAPRVLDPGLIAHGDGVLRAPAAVAALEPEIVVHLGAPHASKVLATWSDATARAGVPHLLVDPYGAFEDPERSAGLVLRVDAAALCAAASDGPIDAAPPSWAASWRRADDAAEAAIARATDEEGALTEPGVARAIFDAVGAGGSVFASSSMPVRDLEWFSGARPDAPTIWSNRGANGIDGVTSTALGLAAASQSRVVALTGDLAFLYDLSALVFGVHERIPDLTIVVIDNAGGGIFSFLPYSGLLDTATYERAFGTPQRPEIVSTVRGLGHMAFEVGSVTELRAVLGEAHAGITVVVARTNRVENVAYHRAVEAAISVAVDDALGEVAR